MSANLKAPKSMFGICGGANTRYPCRYCMASMGTNKWSNTSSIGRPLTRISLDLTNFKSTKMLWDPILLNKLQNIHTCMLHVEIRILNKLICLQLDYTYSIKPSNIANDCIDRYEILLSKMGFHGGQVHLRKDTNLSGK